MLDDLRLGLRRLNARRAPAMIVVTLLGLGIGLTTTAFTLVDALLLRPMPFPNGDRLIRLDDALTTNGVAPPVEAWRQSPMFEAVERAEPDTAELLSPVGNRSIPIARVTPGLFDLLQVKPTQGRAFNETEGRPGLDDRVVLSEWLWRSLFGSDPALIGERITLDDRQVLVVGIMPPDLRFPQWDTVAWVPMEDATPFPQGFAGGMTYARVVDDRAVPSRLEDQLGGRVVMASPVLRGFDEFTQRAFWGLAGGAGLIFLILCSNVVGLLLAQLSGRRRELGVCVSLGASPGRLMRQAFIEHSMLGVAGVALGVGCAAALVSFATRQLSAGVVARSLNPIDLDGRALAATAVLGFAAVMACAAVPAWLGVRRDVGASLQLGDRGGSAPRTARLVTRGLVVGQIAVACALVSSTTLLVRSFVTMSQTERGLDSTGVISVPFRLATNQLGGADVDVVLRELEEAVKSLPGVTAAVASGRLPIMYSSYGRRGPFLLEGASRTVEITAHPIRVAPGFLDLFRIPLLLGRDFEPGDDPTAAVVGQRLATALWPGEAPVGRTFTVQETTYQVIGLAGEITVPTLDRERDAPEFYLADLQSSALMLSLRCGADCPALTAVEARMSGLSSAIAVAAPADLDGRFAAELAEPAAIARASVVFGAMALLTIIGGLFALLGQAVRQRRRDFGIRTALGASPSQIRWVVTSEGLLLAGSGLACGAGLGWFLMRWLSSLQYGVTPLDGATWLTVMALVGLSSLAASVLPAREAARVDPLELLRSE